jgi:ABC-2 type transport system ATP-binding protein
LIEAHELRKTYRKTVAVDGLSLSVERGEVFGFLGPNGAGKTTTIKMLLGLARPSGGRALVLGLPPGEPEAMRRIGFLPEHFRFPSWLEASELLDGHARLHGMDGAWRRRRIPELLEQVGLGDRGRTKLGAFSKGMSQRIGLAQALLNDPQLVVLDEPTSGLDPLGRRDVMNLIRELRAKGTTVFLNSHLLSEVESTCDRVAVIKKGRVARCGTLEELSGSEMEVDVHAEGMTEAFFAGASRWGKIIQRDGTRCTIAIERRESLPEISAALVESGARLYGLVPRRLSLEELFVRIVEQEGEEGGGR